MRTDIYESVTNQIIAELEKGVRPWHKPWAAGHVAGPVSRPLRSNGKAYSGINVLMLWATAMERGYSAPLWMTYRQAIALGAHVRKGEKGAPVVYASTFTRTEQDAETGDQQERQIPFLKSYRVFNVEQIDGLPAHYTATQEPRLNPEERIARAESFFAATGADIRYGGDSAHYVPTLDYIQMPPFEAFKDAIRFYGTLGHEGIHWTRAKHRLSRDFGQKRFGDAAYAMEECVAEIGAAFLCADLGLEPQIRDDHAPYVAGWLAAMKQDKRAIFTAASFAQKAVDYLHSLQPAEESEPESTDTGRAAA